MITVNVLTGSKEWHEHRAKYFNASDAPAMLGKGKISREALLDKYKGYQAEVSDFTQKLFNKGHELEAAALFYAELEVGDDLYPLIGVSGTLSASFDGITLDERTIYEHKTLNAEIKQFGATLAHRIQIQQQFIVSGADKCLFLATHEIDEPYHEWLEPDLELQEQILTGWEQFKKDLTTHSIKAKVIKDVKAPVMELPSVIIQVRGELTLCNIHDVRPVFDKFLSEATVILVTDSDFATAEAESKVARNIAKRCLETEKSVIDQTATISEVTRELRLYADKFNALALLQEKAVKTQKENIKIALLNFNTAEFNNFISVLNESISPIRLVTEQPNFMTAMKGKRTVASLEDAVTFELSRCQSIAGAAAYKIGNNLQEIKEAVDYKFLFNDLNQLVLLDNAHLKLTIATRIKEHEEAQALKLLQIAEEAKRKAEEEQASKLEAERAIIRAEEVKKLLEKEQEAERLWKESEQEMQAKAEALRKTADHIEESAKYADRASDRNAELAGAAKIRKQADDIERSLKPTDKEILDLIISHFKCSKTDAITWLSNINFRRLELGI